MSVLNRFVVSIPMVAVLGLAACTSDEPQDGAAAVGAWATPGTAASAAPRTLSSSPAPAEASPAPPKRLKAARQYVLAAVGAENRPLVTAVPTTSATGKIRLENKYTERALFVPTPVRAGGDTYQLKTGKLRFGGAAYCLEISGKKLIIGGCDADDKDQLFDFPPAPRGDGLLVRAGERQLYWTPGTDQVSVRKGEGTTFNLVDRGEAG